MDLRRPVKKGVMEVMVATHAGTMVYGFPPARVIRSSLDEASLRGWTVVDMKGDWKTVFPPTRGGL